ncbi:hypothetical protein [Ferrovibrio xuzhouensis]|uniref:SPW repeat-containing protein n=1 Tax=Ferrovibrio xuzhouensis TaxID=1576914 RepID=A0ABV7VFS3_9PROT
MPTPVIIAGMFIYIGLGGLMMNFVVPAFGYSHQKTAAFICGLIWIFGWIWVIGALATKSIRDGFTLLRWWVAVYGGLAIGATPIAILPHPATIVLGVILGVAFGSLVATGKIHWLKL